MASVASAASPAPVGMIDPTKQAEYPIFLGDKLLGKESTKNDRYVGIKYNHKAKTAPHLQKTTVTPSGNSQDAFKLTIQDKSPNTDSAAFTYRGSIDPDSLLSDGELNHVVLVFDPKRKAFILEPVSAQLHFNLRAAPGKTNKQVAEQYPQLDILPEDDHASSEDELGPPDDDNPYDFRHFLPKSKPEAENPANTANTASTSTTSTTPDAHNVPNKATTTAPSTAPAPKPKPKPLPKPKTQTNPLREQKRPPKPAPSNNASTPKSKPAEKPASPVAVEEPAEQSSPSEAEGSLPDKDAAQDKPADAAASPNIIVDGDLIIDMGSPPPSRPAFKVNPRHFSSNNTSANEADDDDDDDDIDELDPPLPPGALRNNTENENTADTVEAEVEVEEEEGEGEGGEEEEDDDELAAEMEAAFEEEARNQQMQQQQQPQYHESSDESEVSEEE